MYNNVIHHLQTPSDVAMLTSSLHAIIPCSAPYVMLCGSGKCIYIGLAHFL